MITHHSDHRWTFEQSIDTLRRVLHTYFDCWYTKPWNSTCVPEANSRNKRNRLFLSQFLHYRRYIRLAKVWRCHDERYSVQNKGKAAIAMVLYSQAQAWRIETIRIRIRTEPREPVYPTNRRIFVVPRIPWAPSAQFWRHPWTFILLSSFLPLQRFDGFMCKYHLNSPFTYICENHLSLALYTTKVSVTVCFR